MSTPKRSKAETTSIEQGGGDKRRRGDTQLSRKAQERGNKKVFRKLRGER
jgi:hypothetical protein